MPTRTVTVDLSPAVLKHTKPLEARIEKLEQLVTQLQQELKFVNQRFASLQEKSKSS